jgi:hypothetical protein
MSLRRWEIGGSCDDGEVNSLVRALRDLYYGSGIGLMLRIGEVILERLYGGDTTRWQSRRRKDVSFRKLEKHPDLPFKASMLSRAVSIYVLSRRRADLLELKNVSQTHLQEVLNLAPDLQDRLLDRVEQEKWSVRRLREAVTTSLPKTARRPGRPRAHELARQVRLLRSLAGGRLLVAHPSHIAALRVHQAYELLELARQLCQQTQQTARVLTDHLESLERSRCEVGLAGKAIPRGPGVKAPRLLPAKRATPDSP